MPLTKHEAERLIGTIRQLVAGNTDFGDDLSKKNKVAAEQIERQLVTGDGKAHKLMIDRDQLEAIYRELKNRLIDDMRTDPILLKLVAAQPEIVIEFEPKVVELDGNGLKGRLARLIAQGFFDTPRRQGTTRTELARTGSDVNSGSLSTAFNEFVRDGFLVRDNDDYSRAPGLKVTQKNLVTT